MTRGEILMNDNLTWQFDVPIMDRLSFGLIWEWWLYVVVTTKYLES